MQNSLVNYFARNPPMEEEVDVDAALAEQDLTLASNSLQMPTQPMMPEVDATDYANPHVSLAHKL